VVPRYLSEEVDGDACSVDGASDMFEGRTIWSANMPKQAGLGGHGTIMTFPNLTTSPCEDKKDWLVKLASCTNRETQQDSCIKVGDAAVS
jgi:hypothetical protein